MADDSILIEILRFFINMEAGWESKKKLFIQNERWRCMYVWGCMNFLAEHIGRLLVELERLLAAGKWFAYDALILSQIFYVHQEREKTKWSQKSIKVGSLTTVGPPLAKVQGIIPNGFSPVPTYAQCDRSDPECTQCFLHEFGNNAPTFSLHPLSA